MAERGLKAAAAGALSVVLLVLLAGAWAPSSAGGHVELQQRAALQRLPARRAAMRKQRATALWATQDNGITSTVNTRGYANGDGGISYGSNYVYGPAGTPMVQPNEVSDQWWRYGNQGNYVMTGPSSGGYTPNYELINIGEYQSDGSEWGYELEPATPTYDYFGASMYPGSSSYNSPASVMSPEIGKEAWIATNGDAKQATNGRISNTHPDNTFGDVMYHPEW